jgi:hypothetical protein
MRNHRRMVYCPNIESKLMSWFLIFPK